MGVVVSNRLTSSERRELQLIEGKFSIDQICKYAKSIVERKTANSNVLNKSAENRIPKFNDIEITLGRVLGRGGFCVVNEITEVRLVNDDNRSEGSIDPELTEQALSNIVQDRSFMEAQCLRGTGKECRYAIKRLQDSCYNNSSTFINGIVDLAVEARFLSVLQHPNIIRMRAMSMCSPYDSNFFIVLDRLYDTLSFRLVTWKKQRPAGIKKLLDRNGNKETELWVERCSFAYDLSSALKFLHESNIMYRDIKPENIGFDIRGDIKLFDFGLSKEFDPKRRDKNGLFKFTEDTGSPRYMDPQVALGKRYNELCDVYSFCILLWQMLELQVPFDGYSMTLFKKVVVEGGARPKINDTWPVAIRKMMRSGFGDISQRPTMAEVQDTLRWELSRCSNFEELSGRGLNARSKSIASFRKLMH